MTGGVVPEGADTVVMQERAKAAGKSVTFPAGQKTGQNVREAGEDLKRGAVALAQGRIVRPAELGLLASLGIGEVSVYRPLRVAFFSTGDELKSIGTALGEGEIYDSNRYTLHGMLTRLGCEVLDMGVVRDDPALLEARVPRGRGQRRRRDHQRRRLGGRGRFREAHAGEAGRGRVLEDRHEARPAAGLRQDRRRALLRPARQPRVGDGHLLPVRARGAAAC